MISGHPGEVAPARWFAALCRAHINRVETPMERQFSPIVLIPSRLASTRLPDKPLADICGKPMIEWVWIRAVAASVGQPPTVVDRDLLMLIVLPAAWIAVFIAVAFLAFRKRDL